MAAEKNTGAAAATGETKAKRTRAPSGPKYAWLLYRGEGNIDVVSVERDASKVLDATDADDTLKKQKFVLSEGKAA